MSGPKTQALAGAWKALDEAATTWTRAVLSQDIKSAQTQLSKAARDYAAAYNTANPDKAREREKSSRDVAASMKMPFGEAKGQELRHVEVRHLKWAKKYLEDGQDSWPEHFAESNTTLLNAITSELRFRGEL